MAALETVLAARADEANMGPTGLGVIWMMVFLGFTVICLRLYAQIRVTHNFGLSDCLMIGSIVILITFASLITVQYHYGWGRHQATIPKPQLQMFLKYNITSQCFGITGSTLGRLSFIVFMIRLFGIVHKRLHQGLWLLFALQVLTNGITIIFIYVPCKDARGLWNFAVMATTTCWPHYVQTYIGYAHTSFNALTDLILTVIPISIIWNLQMKLRIKISIGILLSLSILAFIGVIMKIVYLEALSHRGDATYNTVPMFIWIVVETALVEIAASAPLLRPLFRTFLGDNTTHPSGYNSYELSAGLRTIGGSGGGGGGGNHSRNAMASGGGVSKAARPFSKLHSSHGDSGIGHGGGLGSNSDPESTLKSSKSVKSLGSEDEILGPREHHRHAKKGSEKRGGSPPDITVKDEFSVSYHQPEPGEDATKSHILPPWATR